MTLASPRSRWLLLIHWTIILLFASEILYALYQVMVVFAEGQPFTPLGASAKEVPFEVLVARRLYSIEAWIAGGGLAAYLALTEIGPRLRGD